MLRSASPALVRQEHAAWVIAVELARAAARAAAAVAIPARRGRRAGQPVHPRQISFTAARRAVIASVRSGAATASLPAALTAANRDAILAGLARRRVQVDRHRHRDRKTKARPGLPAGRAAPGHPHRASRDQRLPAPDRLTPGNTRPPVEPAAARSDSPAPRHALHSPYNTSGTTTITNSSGGTCRPR